MQVPYFARVASLLNLEREDLFHGAVLWLTLWEIGGPQLEKTGWKMVEKLRLAFGETRAISAAPGHSFRSDEIVELNAFLLPRLSLGGTHICFRPGTTISFTSVMTNSGWSSRGRPRLISNCFSN